MKPTLILVGADKGGVGKTTVARLVMEYLAAHGIAVRAFDTEFPRGTLKRFYPGLTEILDIASTRDQKRIMSALESAMPAATVIDVRAGHFGIILKLLEGLGVIAGVKAGRFNFIVMHVLGSSIASLEEIAETAAFMRDGAYFLVKNFINDATYFEAEPQIQAAYFKPLHAGQIIVPKLNGMAYEQVELGGVSFSTFIADQKIDGSRAGHSFILRGCVRTWMKEISDNLDRADFLRAITGDGANVPAE